MAQATQMFGGMDAAIAVVAQHRQGHGRRRIADHVAAFVQVYGPECVIDLRMIQPDVVEQRAEPERKTATQGGRRPARKQH